MRYKMIIKDIKPKYKCESVDNCDCVATLSIWITGEKKKRVCEEHYKKFCKMISEINTEENK